MNERSMITRVRKALADDPETAPYLDQIRIQIRPGEPFRVEGEVMSIAARRKAVRVARQALPSIAIEDGVRLARSICRPDQELAAVLRDALRNEPALPGVHILEPGAHPPPLDQPWIGAMARDGVVYLGGALETLAARAVAEGLAWETGACSDVKNLIGHEPRCADLDDEIDEAINTLIREHPKLAGQPIEAKVAHAEVSLKGGIADPAQRYLATALCWFVPAVREVHDHLELQNPGIPDQQ